MHQSKLQQFAEEVAADVHGAKLAEGMERPENMSHQDYGNILDTITVIITTIMQLFESCPLQPQQIRSSVKRPTIGQRSMFLKTLRENCECCGIANTVAARRRVNDIYRYSMAKATSMDDGDLDAMLSDLDDGPLDLLLL